MKVADLFAKLGFRVDKASQDKAQNAIAKVGKFAKKQLSGPLAMLTGGALLFKALGANQAFNKSLVRLEVASKGLLGTSGELRKKILAVSDATGIARDKVLQGSASFISLTGDSKTAGEQMELFAKVAQATGADIDDVARSGAAMSQSMGIAGKDFEKAFSILIAGGKAGSVELKDVSQVMAKLAAVSSQFAGGKGVKALSDTSAALQLVTRAFGGRASEGANALEKLMGTMVRSADKLKGVGVDVFKIDPATGNKVRKNFQEIVESIQGSKLAKSPKALIDVLGSKEALAAYEQLVKNKDEWRNLAAEVQKSNDVSEDYAKVSKKASFQIAKAWNKAGNFMIKVADKITGFIIGIGENFEAIKITVLLVAAVFALANVAALSLRVVSVAAAIQTAAAWLLTLAPILLMIALIAVLYFAVQDFISFLDGKDSFFGDIFGGPVQEWMLDIEKFFLEAEKMFREFGSKAKKWVKDGVMSAVGLGGSNRGLGGLAKQASERNASLKRVQDMRQDGQRAAASRAVANQSIGINDPNSRMFNMTEGGGKTDVSIIINGATDPIATGKEVERQFSMRLEGQ